MRNCGGQHQRRPGLSLMGLAACTILISSLSLKQTDWPLYLHEPSSGGMAHLKPANIWPRGPSHTALVTLANQQPMQGVPAVKPVQCLHIHLGLNPMGFSSFCVSPGFFFSSLCLNLYLFYSSPSVAIVCLALTTSHSPLCAHFSYPGNEDRE